MWGGTAVEPLKRSPLWTSSSSQQTSYTQNTYLEDYLDAVIKLFNRHVARGWNKVVFKHMILKIDQKIIHFCNLAKKVASFLKLAKDM